MITITITIIIIEEEEEEEEEEEWIIIIMDISCRALFLMRNELPFLDPSRISGVCALESTLRSVITIK